jgi:hypothetical protein
MRRFHCTCGGVISGPLPRRCPHCGARITGVRRKIDWLGPAIVVLLFAAVVLLAFWLVR